MDDKELRQMTREEAIAFHDSKAYESMSLRQPVKLVREVLATKEAEPKPPAPLGKLAVSDEQGYYVEWYMGIPAVGTELYGAPVKAAEPVQADALQEIHAFLLGGGPLDGVWFGDMHPKQLSAKYWWRNNLREALATSPAPRVKQEPSDLKLIAHLIGIIYFAGNFKAETMNERELEALLVKTGHRYASWQEVDDATQNLAAPSASQGEVKVPEGFALVPKDPTPEMVHAARFYSGELPTTAATCYRAMIAAATAPSVMDGEKK